LGGSLDPQDGADNPNGLYSVSAFSANGNDYVSYVFQSGFSNGSSVIYGYNTVQNVPEPATTAFFAALVAGLVVLRRRR
ncbi:MAG TPA: PEP-CTERM sorting domain-containing protein, partial [Opitutales bacterium]|nr:PEP-CTERM sorting domain-containing protein [Opitutales bacterium]